MPGAVVEKCGQRPELAARPVRERMVVTLGTLHLHAQEDAARAGGHLLALQLVGLKKSGRRGNESRRIGRPASWSVDRRREQLGHQAIVGHVDREAQSQPGVELRHQRRRLASFPATRPASAFARCWRNAARGRRVPASRRPRRPACRAARRPETSAIRRPRESCRPGPDTRRRYSLSSASGAARCWLGPR